MTYCNFCTNPIATKQLKEDGFPYHPACLHKVKEIIEWERKQQEEKKKMYMKKNIDMEKLLPFQQMMTSEQLLQKLADNNIHDIPASAKNRG
jgi:hypothetical protein